jgi:hypothetical protein
LYATNRFIEVLHQTNAHAMSNRVTSSAECLPHSTTFSLPRQVTIEKLSDNVLLKIFCYFLDASPRHWPTLTHICLKWRRIVFDSQQALQIRLFCTHGTPVLKTLKCWPILPIVVQYGGLPALDPPAPEDEDNVVAALKQSDCVTSISLTVTRSLMKKLSTIEGPFSELEDLVLLFRKNGQPTVPGAFQCSPRLRRLHLTRITFPAQILILQLLHSFKNVVDLHLHKIRCPLDFQLDPFTNALSGMDQLRSLSLHFLSTTKHITEPPSYRKLVVLPALICLDFQGRTQHLENLVTRIDAPLLRQIKVTFLNESNFDLSKLRTFIGQTGMHKSHRRADILVSDLTVSISLTRPGDVTYLKFQSPLRDQQSFMAQICAQCSAFHFHVEDLLINATRHSIQKDRLDNGPWLEALNSFTGVKWFHVVGNLSTDIVRALDTRSDTLLHALHKLYIPRPAPRDTLLPALHKLYIPRPAPRDAPLTEAVVSLRSSRQLSGHPIVVEYDRGTGTIYDQC